MKARGRNGRRHNSKEDHMHAHRGISRRHMLQLTAGGLALAGGVQSAWTQTRRIEALDPALDAIIDKSQTIQELASAMAANSARRKVRSGGRRRLSAVQRHPQQPPMNTRPVKASPLIMSRPTAPTASRATCKAGSCPVSTTPAASRGASSTAASP